MGSKRRKILYFTNNDTGRDVEMMIPLLHFAERFLGCKVAISLTPNLHEIFRQRPDCVVLGNTIGAKLHFHIARAACRAGIPVFALVSEGNFPTDGSFNYWGYNTTHRLYESYLCCWSQRTMEFLRGELPAHSNRVVMTGGVGFDRYRIYEFESRKNLLRRHGVDPNRFNRFIGYAGWGFGKLAHPRGRGELLRYFKGDAERLDWAETQRLAMEDILRRMVESQPKTLFILKKHPTETVAAEGNSDHNEMAALREYPNVLYLKDEAVHDLINIVDLWWVYESSTAIEAEMMGKQTLFIVPDGDFSRASVHEGFPEAASFAEVESFTAEFFSKGSLPGYFSSGMNDRRRQIIRETIGWDDGYNHIRAAFYLQHTLEEPRPEKINGTRPYYFLVYWILRLLTTPIGGRLFARIPPISRKRWVLEKYHLPRLPDLRKRYGIFLDRFYERERIGRRFREGTLFIDIFKQ